MTDTSPVGTPAVAMGLEPHRAPAAVGPASAALVVALGLVAVADARLVGDTLRLVLAGLAVVTFAACAVVGWRAAAVAQGRALALCDALLGSALIGAGAALRSLVLPSWPAGLILSLGVGTFLVVRSGALTARALALAAGISEILPLLSQSRPGMVPTVVGLACAAAAVPLLVEGFTRRLRAAQEQQVRDAVDKRMRSLDQDAQDYRLIAAVTGEDVPPEVREQRRTAGSAAAIRETRYELIELLCRAWDPHSAILFSLSPDGKTLKVQELITRSDFVVTGAIPADKGVLGTVLKKRAPLMLTNLSDAFNGVTWYHPPSPPVALLAVPVLDGEHARGVLLVDWQQQRTLAERDAAVLLDFARQLVRVARNEQLFAMMDREKQRADDLFKASHAFISTLKMTDTHQVALKTARQLSEANVAALVVKEGDGLVLAAVDGAPADGVGSVITDESGLFKRCMKTREMLPPAGSAQPEHVRTLLGEKSPLEGIEAIRLCPLEENGDAWGVLVLGSTRRNGLSWVLDDAIRTVATLTSLAVTNRRMYDRMERMATTDGLTGLLNHRTFQERFSEAIKRAQRSGLPLSLILTDIDHFKNVNDTYGHPVGDEVIRRVSQVLARHARTTDVVARYGGEEFAVVLENTDAAGALVVADRIRMAVQKEVVQTELGALKVTLSLGVSQLGVHGTEKAQLVEKSDQALYAAKHGGRNRAVIAQSPTTEAAPASHAEKA